MRHFLAAAVLVAVAVPGLARYSAAPPTPRAQPVCITVQITGAVTQGVPRTCVDSPFPTFDFYRGVGLPGTLYAEVWMEHP